MRDITEILKSENEDKCNENIEKFEQNWSEPFRNYLHRHLKETIFEHSGRWLLGKIGVYNPYSGITNNAAESINDQLKSVQRRKQLPLDMIC